MLDRYVEEGDKPQPDKELQNFNELIKNWGYYKMLRDVSGTQPGTGVDVPGLLKKGIKKLATKENAKGLAKKAGKNLLSNMFKGGGGGARPLMMEPFRPSWSQDEYKTPAPLYQQALATKPTPKPIEPPKPLPQEEEEEE